MVRPYLSVIIPAFNEARRLPLTLIDLDRHLSRKNFSYDITVVASPSTDNTAEILKRFESIIKNFKVIQLKENQGRGLAVKAGMLAVKGNWRLVMDADNSTTIMEFEKMQPYLNDYDIIIGSRGLAASQIHPVPTALSRIGNSISSALIRVFLVRGVQDARCGFKCFSASTADKLFGKAQTSGWALDTEILMLAQKAKYRIKEVPVFWSRENGSHRTPHSVFNIFGEYMRIWWQKKS